MANGGAGQKRQASESAMTGALQSLQEEAATTKIRRLEHHRSARDALAQQPLLTPPFSVGMEDLPEDIQRRILSLLPLKEAARTSIVSRNWRELWTCHPNLCFDGSKQQSTDEDSMKIKETKFIETVNSIVQQHSGAVLNKFSIRFLLKKESSDHLDRWICFAAACKARIMDINLWPNALKAPVGKNYNYPLEALGSQDGPFIQSLFLKHVSLKPHSDIAGFTKLRRLHLNNVIINGDLRGLLNNCCALEDLEIFKCYGAWDLRVSLHLNKLRHMLISLVPTSSIDFHVTGLTHFEYKGQARPIVLHGCSQLEKVSLTFKAGSFERDKDLVSYAFNKLPAISAVKVLNVRADMIEREPVWTSQVDRLMTRPVYMFTRLRHLTCEITIFTRDANSHVGILQFAHYLDRAPELEVLQLHEKVHITPLNTPTFLLIYHADGLCLVASETDVVYTTGVGFWSGEATGLFSSSMGLHRLKKVHMSGFRCYRPQMELLCGILEKGATLENVTIQTNPYTVSSHNYESYIREWARHTSERFGKTIHRRILTLDKCKMR
ncbi:hypothetical protein EJB05_09908, partial [Eragrostis curvula]